MLGVFQVGCGLIILGGLLIAVARRVVAVGVRRGVVSNRLISLAQVVFGEARSVHPLRAEVSHSHSVLSGSAEICQTANIDTTAT
jgi:Na+/alanine symporter